MSKIIGCNKLDKIITDKLFNNLIIGDLMKLITSILKVIVLLAGGIFSLFPIKDRVVFSSYFYNKRPQGNMKLIIEEVRKNGVTVVENFNKYSNTFSGRVGYVLHMLKELYLLNTCRIIVLDGNSFVLSSIKKKPEVKVIQFWHATGAFKKFGNDTERLYKIKNLDYAISSSKNLKQIYSNAFGVEPENVLPLGIPRMDSMYDQRKVKKFQTEIAAKHKELVGKKVILYAPTFRGKGVFDIQVSSTDLNRVAKNISDKYVIAIRMHPLMASRSNYNNFIDLSSEDLIKTLCATDILITDYSSIIFEFSVLKRPMIFFAPDLQDYLDNRGFYEDYEKFVPGKICRSEKELISVVNNNDFEQDKVEFFADKYLDYKDGSSTKRIAALIEKLLLEKK